MENFHIFRGESINIRMIYDERFIVKSKSLFLLSTPQITEADRLFFRLLIKVDEANSAALPSWWSQGNIFRILASQLHTDFVAIKPPPFRQFADIEHEMVPLFVLEALVWNKQRIDLIKYLKVWNCLGNIKSEIGQERRNKILTTVLECLAAGNTDKETVDIMVEVIIWSKALGIHKTI